MARYRRRLKIQSLLFSLAAVHLQDIEDPVEVFNGKEGDFNLTFFAVALHDNPCTKVR